MPWRFRRPTGVAWAVVLLLWLGTIRFDFAQVLAAGPITRAALTKLLTERLQSEVISWVIPGEYSRNERGEISGSVILPLPSMVWDESRDFLASATGKWVLEVNPMSITMYDVSKRLQEYATSRGWAGIDSSTFAGSRRILYLRCLQSRGLLNIVSRASGRNGQLLLRVQPTPALFNLSWGPSGGFPRVRMTRRRLLGLGALEFSIDGSQARGAFLWRYA